MDKVIKRVNIDKENFKILEDMCNQENTAISNYLDYLINRAITNEYVEKKKSKQIYVWRS